MKPLTAEEKKAIAALKRFAKKWPESLWLFSCSTTLLVMKKGEDGRQAFKGEGVDPAYVVGEIDGISHGGGDW